MGTEGEILILFAKNRAKLAEYKEARRIFNEYKEMRAILGKPSRSPFDPEEVKKNLSGENLLSLTKEAEEKKKREK